MDEKTTPNLDVVAVAQKQRHMLMPRKLNSGKGLTKQEIAELAQFEKMAKKTKKSKEKPAERKLTARQQKFVDAYDGCVKTAAEKAGISYDYGRQLYTKPYILETIKNRQDTEVRPKTIATRQQRQQFWTDVMNNEQENLNMRLKASELLGRSEADFTDNVKHSGEISVPELVVNIKK